MVDLSWEDTLVDMNFAYSRQEKGESRAVQESQSGKKLRERGRSESPRKLMQWWNV